MKKFSILITVLLTSISINAQSIAGVWNTGEYNTKIEIIENNGVFNGKIISSDHAEANIGNQILKDIKFSKGERKGKLFAAKKGEWYDAVLKVNGNELDINIKVGFMSKTITWKKE